MPFFLVICMRCIEKELPEKVKIGFKDEAKPQTTSGVFSMDEIMKFIACMPDEILPLYRRQRQYVNAVLALHEADGKDPSCKRLFRRVARGCYIVNPDVIFDA